MTDRDRLDYVVMAVRSGTDRMRNGGVDRELAGLSHEIAFKWDGKMFRITVEDVTDQSP